VGEKATVCAKVVTTRYTSSSRGQPTFLNLDKPYPNQVFTVVIWGTDRSKFGAPEDSYRHKNICVTGAIKGYRGMPEIAASEPAQIKIEAESK
jgi:micrococcal nuclease